MFQNWLRAEAERESCGAVAQVYIVGEVGIQEELDLKGIAHIGGPEDADKKISLKPGFALPHDPDVRRSILKLVIICLSSI